MIGVERTALRSLLGVFDLAHPIGQWVPSGENLGHHLELALRAIFGWLRARLSSHNAGECTHTTRHRPWELDVVIAFRDHARAIMFERSLKSGSGGAFAKRHLFKTMGVIESDHVKF